MSDVLVVGCGLLGTSIGLALRGSELPDVTLMDSAPAAQREAEGRGAGRPWDGKEPATLAVVCVPPGATASTLTTLQRRDVAVTYTHVASAQTHVQAEVERWSTDPSTVVGGHPMAGREVSGPGGAVADLFVGRTWAVCGTPRSAEAAVEAVRSLARACGATPVDVPPGAHDAAVALTSHLPQVLSSALAAQLLAAGDAPPLALAGPALADMTRLAGSSAELWREILVLNAEHVAPAVRAVAGELEKLADALAPASAAERGGTDHVAALLERGRAGRALVPVKRGDLAGAFAGVRVELPDAPGELARLLLAAGEAGVNVEDLRVEHVPGRPRGVVELVVAPSVAGVLAGALRHTGWDVFMSTD